MTRACPGVEGGQLSGRRNPPLIVDARASRIEYQPVTSFTSCVAEPLAAHRTPL